jgi:mono/diheme cytochrome c family protein
MEKQKIRDEIDFKELLRSPLRLYGWFFVYFFLLILAFGIFFGHKLIPISYNEQNVSATDLTNVKLDLVEKKGGIIPAVDLGSVINPSKEMISNGKELYDANCKSCHGDNGLGDGPAGMMLNPKPRNFKLIDGWTNGRTIDALYKTLQEGILSRGMAAYEYLSPSDRFDILHYLRTFAEYPEVTDEQINQMNTAYNLSAGTIQPNQIPVEKAVEKVLIEQKDIFSKVKNAKKRIEQSRNLPGAALLQTYSIDLDKVLYLFAVNNMITFDKYYSLLKNDPQSFGFNPSIIRVSVSDLRTIFDYLKSTMI